MNTIDNITIERLDTIERERNTTMADRTLYNGVRI